MTLTESVTNDQGESYYVLKEDVFLDIMDIIKGRYYDDGIRSINDLEQTFKDVIIMARTGGF